MRVRCVLVWTVIAIAAIAGSWTTIVAQETQPAELILHHGKVVSVDRDFKIHEAIAIKDGQIVGVGSNDEVLKLQGPGTRSIDLQGKTVLPGLIDTHLHPVSACMYEFDHEIPSMETIADVLNYIRGRTKVVEPGQPIVLEQVFVTRLKEQRYPTKAELDEAAPRHPVMFCTGPDASLNSLALQFVGIDKNFVATGSIKVERDPQTGEPTGILRSVWEYLRDKRAALKAKATFEQREERLKQLIADYNAVGLTAGIDRKADTQEIEHYVRLRAAGGLNIRLALSHLVNYGKPLDVMQEEIRQIAKHPLHRPDPWLRIIGIKMFLDGGMLTGSAYMLEPWGPSKIFAIDDPRYRGLRYIEPETLVPLVRTTVESGLQYTAHSVGDGAVQTLIDAYEEVNKTTPIAATRPCVTHSNFMSRQSVEQAAKLGVMLDIQPIWLHMDGRTLVDHFGYDRLAYFQPLRSIFEAGGVVGGGTDHMQKIGARRAVNSYDPFLGMWITMTRNARGYDRPLHPEQALSREQAIRMYTINNAKLMFLDDQIGSLEKGKRADLIVVDRDLLTCPIDDFRETQVLTTYLDGKVVHEKR